MGSDSVIYLPTSPTGGKNVRTGTHISVLEEASRAILSANNRENLFDVVMGLRGLLSLEHIVYHALHLGTHGPETPYLLLSYDPSWVSRYIEQDYFSVDPVVGIATRQIVPLDWGSIDREGPRTKALFAEADRYGVGRQGLTIPIRGPNRERALFTVTSNAGDEDWSRFRSTAIRTFTEIGQILHDRVAWIEGVRAPKAPNLSRREQQCIQMLARGDVPKQIARSLDLSQSAIRLYLHSARCKLGSVTLHQAVARAVALDLIAP